VLQAHHVWFPSHEETARVELLAVVGLLTSRCYDAMARRHEKRATDRSPCGSPEGSARGAELHLSIPFHTAAEARARSTAQW